MKKNKIKWDHLPRRLRADRKIRKEEKEQIGQLAKKKKHGWNNSVRKKERMGQSAKKNKNGWGNLQRRKRGDGTIHKDNMNGSPDILRYVWGVVGRGREVEGGHKSDNS